jgi:hypothetical protein
MTALADSHRAALLARLRRAARVPALLAVFAFALRALVPTGFMLMPVDGHLQWALCPDAGDASASGVAMAGGAADLHAHHHHHAGKQAGMAGPLVAHGADMHGAGAGHESQPHCPFALASAAPLAGSLPSLVAPWSELQLPIPVASRPGRAADAPLRHAAARGPPTLA